MELSSYEKLALSLAIKHKLNSIAHELNFLKTMPPAMRERSIQEYKMLINIGKKLDLNLTEVETLD